MQPGKSNNFFDSWSGKLSGIGSLDNEPATDFTPVWQKLEGRMDKRQGTVRKIVVRVIAVAAAAAALLFFIPGGPATDDGTSASPQAGIAESTASTLRTDSGNHQLNKPADITLSDNRTKENTVDNAKAVSPSGPSRVGSRTPGKSAAGVLPAAASVVGPGKFSERKAAVAEIAIAPVPDRPDESIPLPASTAIPLPADSAVTKTAGNTAKKSSVPKKLRVVHLNELEQFIERKKTSAYASNDPHDGFLKIKISHSN